MGSSKCQRCGHNILAYEKGVHLQSKPVEELLCTDCFNNEMAVICDVQLEDIETRIINIQGRGRKKHTFYISRMVFPMGISLEAIEIQNGEARGYKTSVKGSLDCDQSELIEELMKKIKKVVSKKYIVLEKVGWEKKNCIKKDEVVGRIEWDEKHRGRLPLIIVDGKEYTWEQLGEMMMSFEGWDFKLKIFESWEDL